MQQRLADSLAFKFFAAGVALFIFSGLLWWTQVYTNPYNVFWGMLGGSMTTSSVTKHISEQTSGTQLDQYINLNYGIVNDAYALTTIKSSTSSVKTESIGTQTADYERYTQIDTNQKGKNGKPLSFAGVLGKWAKNSAANASAQTSAPPLFAQAALGLEGGNIVPVANLTSSQRGLLINYLHQNVVFDTSYKNVKKSKQNGRVIYSYDVSIEPVAYVGFEQLFAKDIGLKTLDGLDPNSYQGQTPIKVTMSIDARSHQLYKISYTGTTHSETYQSYGVPHNHSVPKAELSSDKLQQLISQIK